MKNKKNKKLSTTKIYQHLETVVSELEHIRKIVQKEVPPEHFSLKDIVLSFFGATFVGMTVVFNKYLIELPPHMSDWRMVAVMLSTWFVLSFEIYFVGYARVEDKSQRPFFQFWAKRLATFYGVGIVVALFLATLYNVTEIAGSLEGMLKIVVAMSMPCSIGASVADLFKET